jgi:hypothetical protein
MAINPDNITTIRVDQLATATLNVGNEFAHSQGSELKKATIQDLVDIVSTAVGAGSGVGFLPISVTDGQQLPSVPADPSFFLCGPGTYLNVNGFPDVVCTDELNAVMSLADHWQLSVGIPITPDLPSIGISQSVNNGTVDKAPSENAVYNFVYNYVASQILKSSLGYFDYNDLATQTTPISVPSNTQTLLTNDTLGANTDETQPPFGVTSVWTAGTSNFFDFQQLSIGDTVDIRVHLKTTTSANNQLYHIDMKAGIGSASEFENRIFSAYVKTSAVDEQTFVTTFYVGNTDIRDYPAQLFITSVGNTATVEVVGWFVRVFRKSVNIVDIVVAEEAPIDGLVYGRKDAAWFEVTGGGGSQDLQQVTDVGNETTNDIKINELYLYDSENIGYGRIVLDANIFSFYDLNGDLYFQFDANSIRITNNDISKYVILSSAYITDNRILELPDADGTLALTTDVTDKVPYTGATEDVNLGEFGLLTGNIEFDNTPTNIPTTAGSMVWNDTDGTVDLKLKGANVTLQIGQEQVLRVVNKTATNINLLEANYQAVRVTGAQGQRLKVDLAQATTDALSAETIGLVTETINNNQEGFITTSGLIRNINTTGSLQSETWADGDILYLSPTVAGRVTKVKPTAPNHLVIIGYVIHAHATQGSIFIKVDNGYELDELHNVKIVTPANNNVLAYTSATDIWENKTVATILGGTPVTGAGTTGQIAYFPSNGSAIAGREIAEATTGAVISFATPQIYNTFTSPTALDITDSLGTAKIGVVQKIYSNKSVEPTYPAGWKKLSGTYTVSVPNIIYCEWCEGSRVEYWIVKATV